MTLSYRMKRLSTWLTLVVVVLLVSSAVKTQTRTLTHKGRDYSLELPSAKWREIRVPGVAHESTEFRYGDEGLVRLRIRREFVDAGVLPSDLVLRRQRPDRAYLPGYVKGKDQNFDGRLNGAKYPYEYTLAGKLKAGLVYYLQADSRIIYRLEFIGPPKELWDLADQTDFIAQGFRLK